MLLLQLHMILVCGILFWEDLRHRAVHWSLLAQAFLGLGVFGLFTNGHHVFWTDLPVNILFVLLQFIGITLYVSLRERRWVNPFKDRVGPGDLLFMLACAFAFPRHAFVLFILSGIFFSLLGYGVLRLLKPAQPASVPTAGLLALYLATWLGMHLGGVLDLRTLNSWLAHA